MEITVEQRKQLLEYLSRRPYSEVFTLIAMLVSLKPKTNGKEKEKITSKNYWVKSRNYTKNLNLKHLKLSGIGLKILAFLACQTYWDIILINIFSQLS